MVVEPVRGALRSLREAWGLPALAALALLFLVVPLVSSPAWTWPYGRNGVAALPALGAIAGAYAWLFARGVARRKGSAGLRLTAVDLLLLVGVPFFVLAIGNGRPLAPEGGTLGALAASGGNLSPQLVGRWEKSAAALLTLCAGLLLFAGLRRRSGEPPAFATALVFLFATTAFSCSAQALWPVTGALALQCLALFLALRDDASGTRVALAGVAMGAATLFQPSAGLAAVALAAFLLAKGARPGVVYGASAALTSALALALPSALRAPSPADRVIGPAAATDWPSRIGEGLLCNLVSPSRGLLPFFPYLLLLPFALFALREERELRRLWLASLSVVVGTYLLASLDGAWFERYSLGPRWATEAAPFLALLTLPFWQAFARVPRAARIAFVSCALFAAATQVLTTRSSAAVEWNNGIFDRKPGRERVWAVRDGQLAAAWSPVIDVRTRRPADPEIPDDPEAWRHLDLTGAVNACYDHDPFWPGNTDSWSHYGDALSEIADAPTNLFRFLPRGRLNVATTCRGAHRIEVRLPSVACARIHAILAAGMTAPTPGNPVIARCEVEYQDGSVETFPLRLDRDVWEYAPPRRSSPVDPTRLYRGNPQDADALVKSSFALARPNRTVRALRIVNVDAGSPAGVTLFAATLER